MRRSTYKPEPPRPQVGSVFLDSLNREWVCVQPGAFSVTVRLLVDGNITESSVTLDLNTLQPAGKRVNITIEDIQQ